MQKKKIDRSEKENYVVRREGETVNILDQFRSSLHSKPSVKQPSLELQIRITNPNDANS